VALHDDGARSVTTLYPDTTIRSDLTPLAVTVRRACELSGLGATTVWGFIRAGRLVAVRPPGTRRTLITYESLARLLAPVIDPQAETRRRGRPRKRQTDGARP
jgi:hypothetical protein